MLKLYKLSVGLQYMRVFAKTGHFKAALEGRLICEYIRYTQQRLAQIFTIMQMSPEYWFKIIRHTVFKHYIG